MAIKTFYLIVQQNLHGLCAYCSQSDLDNKGGWAAILSVDSNLADFANVSATGRKSTSGFGGIEQGPNERSIEDVEQYDVVTNIE